MRCSAPRLQCVAVCCKALQCAALYLHAGEERTDRSKHVTPLTQPAQQEPIRELAHIHIPTHVNEHTHVHTQTQAHTQVHTHTHTIHWWNSSWPNLHLFRLLKDWKRTLFQVSGPMYWAEHLFRSSFQWFQHIQMRPATFLL